MRTRTKPSRRAFSSTSRNSPVCPLTSGASRTSRVPSRQRQDLVHDGLRRLASQRAAGGGVVRLADARVEQAQVIVYLRGRGDGRARVAAAGALFERDGGGEALDEVHVGLFELVEKLARVGGEALDVAAAALGVEGVEGEAGFARAARPGDDHQLAAGDRQAEILQIMLARAADSDSLLGHIDSRRRAPTPLSRRISSKAQRARQSQ